MGSPISTKRTSMQSTKILQKQLLKTRSSLLPAHHVIQRKHLLGVQSKPVSYWQVVRTEGIRRFDFLFPQKKHEKVETLVHTVQYSESRECDFQIPGSRFLRAGGRLAKAEGRRPDASAGQPCRPSRTLLAKSGTGRGSGGTGRGHTA